jgi:hypothetical protein
MDGILAFFGCFVSDGIIAAGAETSGKFWAQLDAHCGFGNFESLGICIHRDELYAVKLLANHPGNGVTT